MDIQLLKQIPAFASLADDELKAVAIWANEASVSEGSTIVHEGEFAYQFFAIEEGRAEVLRGEEKIAELGPGDFFGEIGLLEKERRGATVKALSPMRLMTLTAWDMRRLQRDAPGVMERIREVLAERKSAYEAS